MHDSKNHHGFEKSGHEHSANCHTSFGGERLPGPVLWSGRVLVSQVKSQSSSVQ